MDAVVCESALMPIAPRARIDASDRIVALTSLSTSACV